MIARLSAPLAGAAVLFCALNAWAQPDAPDTASASAAASASPNLPPSSAATLTPELQRNVTRLYERGNRLLDAKRYAEAERAFLDALKIAPGIAAIHHGLGLVYIQTEDYELAVLHLEEAWRSEPNRVKTIYTLARAYANVGENQKAEEGYLRAIQIDPNFAPAHQELAGIYYRNKNWNEALKSLERARAIDSKSAHTLMLIGVVGIHADRQDIALDAVTALRKNGHYHQARRLEYQIFKSRESEKKPS